VKHNHVLHRYVLILSIETLPVPHVPAGQRLTIDPLGHKDDRITHVTARFGYMDEANVPVLLPLVLEADPESPVREGDVSYFLSTIALRPGSTPGMSRWRKRLFFATAQITADVAEYFRLPRERTVIMVRGSSSNRSGARCRGAGC
jgi:KUP system potassium uptake protein